MAINRMDALTKDDSREGWMWPFAQSRRASCAVARRNSVIASRVPSEHAVENPLAAFAAANRLPPAHVADPDDPLTA